MSERDEDQILKVIENKAVNNLLIILTNPLIYVWFVYVAYLTIAIAILPIFYGTSPVYDDGPIDFFHYFILGPIIMIGLAFAWEYMRCSHSKLRWKVILIVA